MTEPISKSCLSDPHRRLIETMQRLNFGRIENLPVRDGAPIFGCGARFIQKVKIGGDNGPRPEATFDDFLLKKQTIELIETLTDLGDGMVLAIEVKHRACSDADCPSTAAQGRRVAQLQGACTEGDATRVGVGPGERDLR